MLLSEHNTVGASPSANDPPRLSEEVDSFCSTPFVSAPSSPGHGPSGYFFSAPASPMHFLLSGEKFKTSSSENMYEPIFLSSDSGSLEFEFSSRFSPTESGENGSMASADKLFCNGQIRPMKLSSHRQRPQENVVPFLDLCADDGSNGRGRDMRTRSAKYSHRKVRSMSPLRTMAEYEWKGLSSVATADESDQAKENGSSETTPSYLASSSRSSSSGRNSKKWIFLKDLLYRSKSEGRAHCDRERFWSAISFSPAKERKNSLLPPALSPSSLCDEKKNESETKKARKVQAATRKPANGVWKRRVPPSAHELHYTANRAQAEEMKKKTFLPYRQSLLGFLGFSSKSYSAFNGFTRNLNPISSR